MAQPTQPPQGQQTLPDLTGTSVGRFAIRARLGAGAMGEVYLAEDPKLKRRVALKRMGTQLREDDSYRRRFLKEAEMASRLTDQHIAGIYDVLEENGETFLVMEYVEGQTLRQRLGKPLAIPEFLDLGVQCAAALAAAHAQGVIHCDIKPENIMLTAAGRVKVLDFGVAKRTAHSDQMATLETLRRTAVGLSGTPAYMAPEVLLDKEPDGRADIFSLGLVFYEALAGRHPFQSGTLMSTCNRILHDIPQLISESNPQVPAELERIIAKMLAKDPAERYATAADLVVDLRGVQGSTTYPVLAPAERPTHVGWQQAISAVALAGIVLAVVLAAVPSVRQQFRRWLSAAEVPQQKHIAVLPITVVGSDPEMAAFADGLADTLTAKLTELTATHALQVVPSREVRTYRVTNAEEARKNLGASLALETTLQKSGRTIRANSALVDTRTLRQLAADTITADASDPFAFQDGVVNRVVEMLDLHLKPREREALAAHGTQVAGAYDLYLQGRGHLQNYDKPENIESAITVFGRALELDASYALAYAGLGEAYWKKYESGKETQWVEKAQQACARGLELDAKLAAAQICLGTLHNGTGHYEEAVVEFRRALESEPTNDDAHRGLAEAYASLGKPAEAEKTYRRAIELRRHYWAGYNWLGKFYWRQARYSEAVEMFTQVVALAPDSFQGYSNLGAMHILQGRYTEAISALERSIAIRPTAYAYSNLGVAYFYQRRFAEAATTYEQALKWDEHNYELWANLAEAYYWTPTKHAMARGAYRKAIYLARERLQVNPHEAYLLANLALYCAMSDEPKRALDYLGRALKLAPDDPEVRFKVALIYSRLGEINVALEWLEKALAASISPTRVRNDPIFDRLHGNAKFEKLLQGH